MSYILPIDEMMKDRYAFACDGLFLIFDTAKHNGFSVTSAEVRDHINECRACQNDSSVLSSLGI